MCHVAAVPITVHWAIELQAVGIHAFTHAPQLVGQIDIQASVFVMDAVVCSTVLTMNIIAMSQTLHVLSVLLAKAIEIHIQHVPSSLHMQVLQLRIKLRLEGVVALHITTWPCLHIP